jgi:DNA polymerase III epsilon subunit-like protein
MQRLYWDIETTPNIGYFWKSGWRERISPESILDERRIICISYKFEHSDVKTITWKNGSDKKLVKDFVKIANTADILIAHNGDRFDLPWFRTRCLFHGVEFPPKPVTIDTLKRARGNFYFNSNKLDYIAQFLGLGKKAETGGFDLWKDVMNGDKEALQKMVHYCEQDVILLQKVHDKLAPHVPHTGHEGVMQGGEKWHCPHCGSDKVQHHRKRTTATGVEKYQMKCGDCKRFYTISTRQYIKFIKERLRK